MSSPVLLITGANGFLGRSLSVHASMNGKLVRQASRQGGKRRIAVGDIGPGTDWSMALQDVQFVVHLVARVHVMRDRAVDSLRAYRHVNTEGTLNLARQAAAKGIRRFIYISTIKVNGEETPVGWPFTEEDVEAPLDPYGISKMEAEEGLRLLAAATGMEVVILRPPLVYGPGVKANFLSMMQWLSRGVPLPFGSIHNRRSLVALDNLIDLIVTCLDHPSAANQTFLAADGEDLATPDLLRRLGLALGKPACLMPIPAWLLQAAAAAVGKRDLARRLCGSLQVDITKARTMLGWKPPVSVDDALQATARDFLESRKGSLVQS